MSKIKMSFSLILTFILVGIISTAVFASSAYGLKATADGNGGFNFSFTKISTDTQTDFTLKVYSVDPSTKALSSDSVFSSAATSGVTVNVPKTAITVGTIYDFVLTHTTGGDVVGEKFGVLTDFHNLNMANVADAGGKISYTKADGTTAQLDIVGTGLANANHTGQDAKRPSTGDHGFYQNNTASCGVCHQTHTAANGESLLFKDGVYSTCSACHDGTTGAYNSFTPATAATVNSIGGSFNVHDAGQNGSLHVADGSLDVSAAPGGNHTLDGVAGTVNTATWGAEFDCASCHNPHGGGSANENNLSQDPLGWGAVAYKSAADGGSLDQQNGKLFQGKTIFTSVPTTLTDTYILVSGTASGVTTDKTKVGYLYSRAGVNNGDAIIQTYRWDGNKYVADYSLWLRDIGHVNAPFKNANTVLKDSTGKDITSTGMTTVWKDGFAFGSGVSNVATYDLSIGIDVETSKSDIASLYDSTDPNYIVDSGTELSKYCAGCHTDYASTTRTNNTGLYSVAHRHATMQDRLTCVRCHYAHGSEAQIMKDANDNSYWNLTTPSVTDATKATSPNGSVVNLLASDKALSYLTEPNADSALKRYVGMSVCYSCHGKGEQFLGNPNNDADKTTGQFLQGGDPGVVGPTGTVPGSGRYDLLTRH